jgi:hypothetical protein
VEQLAAAVAIQQQPSWSSSYRPALSSSSSAAAVAVQQQPS